MKMNTKQTDHPAVPAGEEGCVVGKDPALAGFTMIALLLGMLLAVYALIASSSPLSAKILVLLLMLLVIVMLWRYKAIYITIAFRPLGSQNTPCFANSRFGTSRGARSGRSDFSADSGGIKPILS